MRQCTRCGTEMVDNYSLKASNISAIATILLAKKNGILSNELGKIKVAVCPNCGELSLYFDQLEKLK